MAPRFRSSCLQSRRWIDVKKPAPANRAGFLGLGLRGKEPKTEARILQPQSPMKSPRR